MSQYLFIVILCAKRSRVTWALQSGFNYFAYNQWLECYKNWQKFNEMHISNLIRVLARIIKLQFVSDSENIVPTLKETQKYNLTSKLLHLLTTFWLSEWVCNFTVVVVMKETWIWVCYLRHIEKFHFNFLKHVFSFLNGKIHIKAHIRHDIFSYNIAIKDTAIKRCFWAMDVYRPR